MHYSCIVRYTLLHIIQQSCQIFSEILSHVWSCNSVLLVFLVLCTQISPTQNRPNYIGSFVHARYCKWYFTLDGSRKILAFIPGLNVVYVYFTSPRSSIHWTSVSGQLSSHYELCVRYYYIHEYWKIESARWVGVSSPSLFSRINYLTKDVYHMNRWNIWCYWYQ